MLICPFSFSRTTAIRSTTTTTTATTGALSFYECIQRTKINPSNKSLQSRHSLIAAILDIVAIIREREREKPDR
jgi:hypothetical protein